MTADKIKRLESKLEAFRGKPGKGIAARKRIDILNELARALYNSEPKKSERYANEALDLAMKLADSGRISRSYKNIGKAHYARSDYKTALKNLQKALNIDREIKDAPAIASSINNIGAVYWRQGKYKKALENFQEALGIREKIGEKKDIADSYHSIGVVISDQGDPDRALEYYYKALQLREELNDRNGLANSYNCIAAIYEENGDHVKCLEYYLKSLRIAEGIGDKMAISQGLRNISGLFETMGDQYKAFNYAVRCLKISQEIDFKENIAYSYISIAIYYCNQSDHDKALKYGHLALTIHGETGDRQGQGCACAVIGAIFEEQKALGEALKWFEKSLKIYEEIGWKSGVADDCRHLGDIHTRLSNYDSAANYLEKGCKIAREIQYKFIELNCYDAFVRLFEAQHDYENALAYLRKFIALKEEIFDAEKNKQIASMRIRYETEKKEKEVEIYRLKNVEMRREIMRRKTAEKELKKHRDDLEELVLKRTSRLEKEIAERKYAEQTLLDSQKQLRSLAREASLIEEKQRRKFAIFLHDDISQALALATFKLRSIQETNPGKNVRKELGDVNAIIDKTAERTRTLATEISPPILYELGLEPALEWLVRQFGKQYKISAKFEDDGLSKPLSDDARVFLFQSVRELLSNVSKHAQAHSVKVSAIRSGNNIRITVEDDGVGFNPKQNNMKMIKNEGFGLFNVRERLRHLNGQLKLRSKEEKGTSVVLIAPLTRIKRARR